MHQYIVSESFNLEIEAKFLKYKITYVKEENRLNLEG